MKLSSLFGAVLVPGHCPSDLKQWELCDDLYLSFVAHQPLFPLTVGSSS